MTINCSALCTARLLGPVLDLVQLLTGVVAIMLEAARSPLIPAAQILSWHTTASNSESLLRPEVCSTCNYWIFFLFFFCSHFCWSGRPAFTHAQSTIDTEHKIDMGKLTYLPPISSSLKERELLPIKTKTQIMMFDHSRIRQWSQAQLYTYMHTHMHTHSYTHTSTPHKALQVLLPFLHSPSISSSNVVCSFITSSLLCNSYITTSGY